MEIEPVSAVSHARRVRFDTDEHRAQVNEARQRNDEARKVAERRSEQSEQIRRKEDSRLDVRV